MVPKLLCRLALLAVAAGLLSACPASDDRREFADPPMPAPGAEPVRPATPLDSPRHEGLEPRAPAEPLPGAPGAAPAPATDPAQPQPRPLPQVEPVPPGAPQPRPLPQAEPVPPGAPQPRPLPQAEPAGPGTRPGN